HHLDQINTSLRDAGMTDQQPERDQESGGDEKTFPIVCELCGSKARLPFRPRRGQTVYCPDCYRFKRKEVRREREKSSPRKQHGTRVSFPIECAQCGREEVLDYVPKGVKPDEALCSECVRTTYGDKSRWAEIKQRKSYEQKQEWEIVCVDCGRPDFLKFPPDPEKDYRCVRCYNSQESPEDDRLQGKRRIGRSVYIKESDEKADDDQ
ncbi:MAG: CxxC-x17-CxxC domain-containing protein, partial [Persicimonas sp.]